MAAQKITVIIAGQMTITNLVSHRLSQEYQFPVIRDGRNSCCFIFIHDARIWRASYLRSSSPVATNL